MENILCKEAGVRIRTIRKIRGLSRDSLADEAGISSKFLYEIEQGKKRFSAEVLCSIAKVLDVSCDYIMHGEYCKYDKEVGIEEMISLFDTNQQQKLVSLIQLVYEMLSEKK